MLESWMHWLLDRFRDLGYPGIVMLMAIESSVLPLPSELVMPPAGYLAAKGEMHFGVAVACGVLGSILGALANYGVAHWLGRAFLRRLGRYVWISDRLARMNLVKFVVFTGLGAVVWCSVLTWIGWFIGKKEDVILTVLNEEAQTYAGRAVLIMLPVLAVIAIVYVWWHRRRVAQRSEE